MIAEQKTTSTGSVQVCQNCKTQFTIEPDDFDFYKKIDVPPPTFCPDCRLQRRLMWRNERSLYRRECDLCKKAMVNRFPAGTPFPVYCNTCWKSDKWDPRDYGQDYDFSKPFFVQFFELMNRTPQPATFQVNAVNSDYCITGADLKNVYLSASIVESEDVNYSYRIDKSRNVFDSAYGYQIERCYENINTGSSSGLAFAQYILNSLDSWFLYDCRNVSSCIGCVNLRNGKYKILNKQYSPEDWKQKVQELDLGSYRNLQKLKTEFEAFSLQFPRRAAAIEQSVGVVGNNMFNSKNCYLCFDGADVENSKYCLVVTGGARDTYDATFIGLGTELCYEVGSCKGHHVKFSIGWGQDIEYSHSCFNFGSSHLFGCASMAQRSEYCILNKQYTKEEYEALVPKIRKQMEEMPYTDKRGVVYRYGEFFPAEFSPFGYNETLAQEYFPLTQDETLARGYAWKDPEVKQVQITKKAEELPDHIKDVTDDILNEVIGCAHSTGSTSSLQASSWQVTNGTCRDQCTTAFKVIPEELQMHRLARIPLPRLCPNCRHAARLKKRNPIKLQHRSCQCAGKSSDNTIYYNTASHSHGIEHCPNEFETTYAPDRPEIVYCESCYQSEVV